MSSTNPESTPPKVVGDRKKRIEPLDLFSQETVDNLAGGFLAVFEPELVRVEQSLAELV